VAPEAEIAYKELKAKGISAALLQVTSPDRLYEDWQKKGDLSRATELLKVGSITNTNKWQYYMQ